MLLRNKDVLNCTCPIHKFPFTRSHATHQLRNTEPLSLSIHPPPHMSRQTSQQCGNRPFNGINTPYHVINLAPYLHWEALRCMLLQHCLHIILTNTRNIIHTYTCLTLACTNLPTTLNRSGYTLLASVRLIRSSTCERTRLPQTPMIYWRSMALLCGYARLGYSYICT